jgi:mono/diheme cytochrome c family protein
MLIIALAGCGSASDGAGEATPDDRREETVATTEVQIPSEYRDLSNPLVGDEQAVQAGADIFRSACATCHGETGQGDGPAAQGLDPKPASLADTERMQNLNDGYLYWRIHEGGAMTPFNSSMPAWGSVYSEEQIWQLVTFIRSLHE